MDKKKYLKKIYNYESMYLHLSTCSNYIESLKRFNWSICWCLMTFVCKAQNTWLFFTLTITALMWNQGVPYNKHSREEIILTACLFQVINTPGTVERPGSEWWPQTLHLEKSAVAIPICSFSQALCHTDSVMNAVHSFSRQ